MFIKTRLSKSASIANTLRDDLSALRLAADQRVASASEVAERFEVSVPTAHEAINLLVDEGLLYRVRGSGTFVKNNSAQRPLRIGLADSSIMPVDSKVRKILDCHIEMAYKFLLEKNCEVHIFSYLEFVNTPVQRLAEKYDGFLVSINYMDSKTLDKLGQSGRPFVFYRGDFQISENHSQVYYDISQGARECLQSLALDKGERPVLFYEESRSGLSSMQVWRQALLEAGLAEKNISLVSMLASEREISCYRLVRVHHREYRQRLLLAFNDEIAANLIRGFFDEGMQPGRDYRLASMGNREGYGYRLAEEPVIASVDMPMQSMAEEACKLLLRIIEQPSKVSFSVRIPTSFINRKSLTAKNNENIKAKTGA